MVKIRYLPLLMPNIPSSTPLSPMSYTMDLTSLGHPQSRVLHARILHLTYMLSSSYIGPPNQNYHIQILR